MENQLDLLDKSGLFNIPVSASSGREFISRGRKYYDFCSTNYLGYEFDPRVHEAAVKCAEKWGCITSWSRMEADCSIYTGLEKQIGELIGVRDVLAGLTITMTGFSLIPAIAEKGIIFADGVLHTVVWEACRLARDHGSKLVKFRHQDLAQLEQLLQEHRNVFPKMIAVDGVYSISTDLAPIVGLQALCEKYGAYLYVDDAHGFGILGKNPTKENPYGVGGLGVVNHLGGNYDRTFYVSSFGKALCAQTAFCTLPLGFKGNLRASSLQYLYSAPPSPYLIGATEAVMEMNRERGELDRAKIRGLVDYFVAGLSALNLKVSNHLKHPVVYVEVGELPQLMKVAARLDDGGFLAGLRAYPVVPADQCGFRFAVTALNERAHIDRVLGILARPGVLSEMRQAA